MIIRKMRASFGCLENTEMELREGLNIITAPNESGKSTWCAFIRAMLYGVDSAQREKGGVKPDKVKYAPWSGAPMAGEMEIEHEGKAITLSRGTKTAAAPMREFSATYTGTKQRVPGLTGKDAGETLTGMPRAVFESSVFVRQSGMAVSSSAELERRINAIISSGEDEGVSYTAADAFLRAWQRKRRHNNSGAIPAVEADIAEKRSAISDMAETVRQRELLEKRLRSAKEAEKCASEASRLEAETRRRRLIDRVESARRAAAEADRHLAEAREDALRLKAETEKGPFGGMSAEEARIAAKTDADLLFGSVKARPKLSLLAAIVLLIMGAAVVLTSIFTFNSLALYVVGAFAMLCGGAVLARRRGMKKEADSFALAMAHRYGNPDPDSILDKAETHADTCAAAEKAASAVLLAQAEAEKAREALKGAEAELLGGGTHCLDDGARQAAETAMVERQIALCEGRLEAMGDPMVLGTELEALTSRRDELQAQYDALALAISTLREANDEMQQRFSPRLGQRSGEIMQALTGGEYERVAFDRSLAADAKRSGDTVSHPAAFLSQGTADQLYLALRLAICELALPEDCSCPLVLDDALVNFDSQRMGYALELLKEIAKTRQVILFSCHDREEKYIAEKS